MEHPAEQVQKMKEDADMREKILQGFYAWEEKMRDEDAQYKLSRNSKIHSLDKLPPIRGFNQSHNKDETNSSKDEEKVADPLKKLPQLSPIALSQKSDEEKERGNALYKAGKLEEALTAYAKALETNKDNIACYSNRALIFTRLGRYLEAEKECDAALQLDPEFVKVIHRRAVARRYLNKYKGAKEDLLHILDLEPKNKASAKLLKEVEEALSKCKEGSPTKLPDIVNREEKRNVETKEKVAVTSNKELVVDTSTVPNKTASPETAMIDKSKEEINHKKTALEWKEEGNRHYDKHEHGSAYDCYTKAINLDKSEAIYLANRAMVLIALERFEEAEKDSSAAICLNPGHVKSYQRRAVARMKLGKLLEAKEDLATAEKLDPRNRILLKQKKELQQLFMKQQKREDGPLEQLPVIQAGSKTKEEKIISQFYDQFKPAAVQNVPEGIPVAAQRAAIKKLEQPALVPAPAKNYAQFLVDWKRLKNDELSRYKYLKQMKSSDLSIIFRESLEPDELSGILSVLASHFVPNEDSVLPCLSALSKVKRFRSASMFLSDEDQKCVNIIFTAALERQEDDLTAIDKIRSAWSGIV